MVSPLATFQADTRRGRSDQSVGGGRTDGHDSSSGQARATRSAPSLVTICARTVSPRRTPRGASITRVVASTSGAWCAAVPTSSPEACHGVDENVNCLADPVLGPLGDELVGQVLYPGNPFGDRLLVELARHPRQLRCRPRRSNRTRQRRRAGRRSGTARALRGRHRSHRESRRSRCCARLRVARARGCVRAGRGSPQLRRSAACGAGRAGWRAGTTDRSTAPRRELSRSSRGETGGVRLAAGRSLGPVRCRRSRPARAARLRAPAGCRGPCRRTSSSR